MVRQKKLLKNNLTVDKENFNSLNTSKSESMRPKSQQIKFQLPKSIKKQFDPFDKSLGFEQILQQTNDYINSKREFFTSLPTLSNKKVYIWQNSKQEKFKKYQKVIAENSSTNIPSTYNKKALL